MKAERTGTLLLFLADALTLFLLLCGGLASFLPVSRFQVDAGVLILWCALFSAASAGLFTWRWGGWAALGLLAAEGLLVWRSWEELAFGIWLDGGWLDGGSALEFFLLAFALALVMGWVVVRTRCWYLAALIVLTPLLPAIMEGVLPNWNALTAATAGWGTMLLSALYSRQNKVRLARGTLLSLGGMGVLLLTLNLALPMEGYDRPQWATDARDGLIAAIAGGLSGDWAADWEVPEFFEDYLGATVSGGTGIRSDFSVGEDGTVDLLSAGPRSYSGRTVMEVRNGRSRAGFDYLRGGTAAVYTGESWEAPANEFEDASVLPDFFPAMNNLERTEETLAIRSLYPGTTAYVPYGLTDISEDVTLCTDGSARKRRGLREYEMTYSPRLAYQAPLEGEAAEAEARYREYVYENYLDVPQAAREALTPLAQRMQTMFQSDYLGYPEQWRDAMDYAQDAAALLSRLAVYDLNTPAMEPGEDFVTHFLEEGRGYCVHFATAGVLLLRMKGIPARYASGYVYEADENGNGLVKDSGAHAWVEVYLDGRGWLSTYEMTPGYSGTSLPVQDGAEEEILPPEADGPELPEEPDEPDLPEDSDGPEEADDPEEPDELEEPEDTEPPETPEPSEAEGPAPALAEIVDLGWLKPIAEAAVVLAVFFALYRLGMNLRRRERELPDANRSVIRAYLRCRRLMRWGAGEIPELEALAQKAKFSQHILTARERETAWALMEGAGERLEEQMPRWKRIIFRCVRPVWF